MSSVSSLHEIITWVRLSRSYLALQELTCQWKYAAKALFVTSKPIPPAVHLLGTKKDLRRTVSGRRFSLGYYYNQLPMSPSLHASAVSAATCVSSAQATAVARDIDARYWECSALTGEGVARLVGETAEEATTRVVEREYALYRGIKRMALS